MSDVQWSLSGDYLEACSCDAGCPCKFGASPTKGHCQGVIGFRISEGIYGDVDLSGLGLALMLMAPGAPWEGGLTVTAYLDERATDEQQQALGEIVSGNAGGFWAVLPSLIADNKGVKTGALRMETSGKRRTFSIPGVVDVVNEPLVDPLTGEEQEVTVANTTDPFCPSGRAGRSVKATVTDPDISFDHSGQQGYIGTFSWGGP